MGEGPSAESATGYCERTRKGFEVKADHNKRESLFFFALVIVSTAATPLFVTLGSGIVVGKVIPSVLSISATIATAWLQLRRPQQLWGLYRGAQRELEHQHTAYRFRLGEYSEETEPERLLATRVAEIAFDAHKSWTNVIPSPEQLGVRETGHNSLPVHLPS